MRPAETCIFTTRFSENFRGCPFFHPVDFTPTTWTGHPLKSHVVCRHLEVAGTEDLGPFYPRCGLGGPEVVRQLADELNGATQLTG
jgi:hypothetical protein